LASLLLDLEGAIVVEEADLMEVDNEVVVMELLL